MSTFSGCVSVSIRFFAVIALFFANPAFAEIPLAQILESAAGRFIFGETLRGSEAAFRLLGRDVSVLERGSALRALLTSPERAAAAADLSARLNRIHDAFRAQSPELADSLFAARAAARPMNAAEAQALQGLVRNELTREAIQFLPAAGAGSGVADDVLTASRRAFVDGLGTGAAQPELPALQAWENEGANSLAATAFRSFKALAAARPEIQKVLNPSDVHAILSDAENSLYAGNLKKVLDAVAADGRNVPVFAKLRTALKASLKGQVPARTIPGRILALQKGGLPALKRAMGDMSLEEVQLMLHGGNPLQPTADSLVGRYLSETGAQSVVRTFPIGPAQGPGASTTQGPSRLVVTVSAESLPAFQKYFTNPHWLGHLHTPEQGTLYLAYNGKVGSYAQISGEFRMPREGTLLPQVLMKTSEAQRATQFFELGQRQQQTALTPWQIQGYCATGGYSSCTHWFGNIPIGDRLVAEYRFPGAIDQYAGNRVPDSPEPRVQALAPYDTDEALVRRVWKAPLGNEQLGDVIGLGASNLRGELANPGWVLISLTGPAPAERVPVVFYFVANHRTSLAADFPVQVRAY